MNTSSRNRTIHQRQPLLSLLMFFVLSLGSLASFAPYLSTPAAAQPLCLDGQVWSEEEQACVEIALEETVLEEPTPTETPQPTETPEDVVEAPLGEQGDGDGANDDQAATGSPAAEMPGDDLSSLQAADPAPVNLGIGSYACPEDFDAYSSSIDVNIIQDACNQLNPGVEFTVIVGGEAYAGQTYAQPTTGGIDTLFGFSIPAGDISISQTQLEKFGQPVVACDVRLAQGGTAREYRFYPVIQGNTIEINDVEAGQNIRCNWYSVPTDASAVVIVKNFACPPGFNTSIAGPDELKQNCPAYKTPVEFQLIHVTGGGVALQLVKLQTTALSPAVVFRSVKAGDFRIREVVPTGFGVPIVYCEQFGPNGQTIRQYDRYIMFSVDSIAAITNTLETLSCDWFNVPGQLPVIPADAPLGENAPPDTGIPVAQLPDQFDQVEEVEVPDEPTLDDGTPVAQLPDQSDVAEEAEIPDDTAGPVTIVPPLAERAEEIEIPDDSPGRVTIEVYECPESFDAYNATPNEINTRCPYAGYTDGQNFEFSLIDGAGTLEIQHTGLKQPYLEFEQVVPGVISITVAVPGGFGEPVVYCQAIGPESVGPLPYERQTLASPSSIEHSLYPEEWFACAWFNVPTGSAFNDVPGDVFVEQLPLDTIAEPGVGDTATDSDHVNTETQGDDHADDSDATLLLPIQERLVGITVTR